MDDLISRQAALDIVFDFAEAPHNMYQKIRELPSAEKHGKWTKYTLPDCTYFICSLCGWESIDSKTIYDDDGWYVDEVGMTYCPNCGARMKDATD